jgi:dCMP deaminase
MASQKKLDQTYMAMAEELSKLSYANRKKVGCLIVKDTQIISEGYNGTPKGFSNECEYRSYVDEEYTKPEVLHAESNAISKIARSTNSSDGATLYVTLAPCFDCAKLIIQSGIVRVIYKDHYKKNGLNLLAKAGVKVNSIYEYDQDTSDEEFPGSHYKGDFGYYS